jgi:fibronectin type 3 domain-containing protein
VRGVDLLGREGATSAAVTYVSSDKSAPAAPQGVTATPGGDSISVVWVMSPEPDVRGYHVERGPRLNAPFTRLTTQLLPVDRPAFVDSAPQTGVQYFYRVIAIDSSGNLSKASNPGNATLIDNRPPPAPTALRATRLAKHRVQLQWTAPNARDVVGYFIYRNEVGGPTTRVSPSPVPVTSFIDVGPDSIGITPGSYRLQVSAIDREFNEGPKASVEITIPDDVPPKPPTGFQALNVLGRYVNVIWSSGGSIDVRQHVLERSVDGGPSVVLRTVPVSADRSFRDTVVTHGHRYVYSLHAVDSAGNRSAVVRDSVRFGDFTPPPAPRNAYARRLGTDTSAARRSVIVRWERVVDSELAGYVVYRSNAATGAFTKVTPSPLTILEWTDRASPADAWYQVRAVDRSGNESAPGPAVRAPLP